MYQRAHDDEWSMLQWSDEEDGVMVPMATDMAIVTDTMDRPLIARLFAQPRAASPPGRARPASPLAKELQEFAPGAFVCTPAATTQLIFKRPHSPPAKPPTPLLAPRSPSWKRCLLAALLAVAVALGLLAMAVPWSVWLELAGERAAVGKQVVRTADARGDALDALLAQVDLRTLCQLFAAFLSSQREVAVAREAAAEVMLWAVQSVDVLAQPVKWAWQVVLDLLESLKELLFVF